MSTYITPHQHHTLLPHAAQDALRDAAAESDAVSLSSPISRRRIAVDEAIERIKRAYPECFIHPTEDQGVQK